MNTKEPCAYCLSSGKSCSCANISGPIYPSRPLELTLCISSQGDQRQCSWCKTVSSFPPAYHSSISMHLLHPSTQPHAYRLRYAVTIENRLAHVEDAIENRLTRVEGFIQRLMPMAQALESRMHSDDQKLLYAKKPPNLPQTSLQPPSSRASPETDNAAVTKVTSPSNTSHQSDATLSQKPPAPTIQSYLLPNSQGVPQPPFSGKPYMPSKGVQKLAQYPSGGRAGNTGMSGTSGRSTSQISSPAVDRLLDDDVNGANERWSDRFSFVAKDSYGNLRCALFHPFCRHEIAEAGLQLHWGHILDDVR